MKNNFIQSVLSAKKEQNLSTRDVARLTGVSHSHLGNILNGRRPPTWETTARLGVALLGVPPHISFKMAGLLPVQLPTKTD